MLNIPNKYKIGNNGKRLNLKTFITADLTTVEKKRLRDNLKKVTLTHQISGENIPSLINDEYNCAVIIFLDIELADIKHKYFIGRIIQNMIKPYCVIRFYDSLHQAFCFAHKRLSKTEQNEIVVDDIVVTNPFGLHLADCGLFTEHLEFSALKNTVNKRDLYLEAMTKTYLCDNNLIFSDAQKLFESKVWFNSSQSLNLLRELRKLQAFKYDKTKAVMSKEKVILNTQIKKQINIIKKNYLGA